MTLEEYFGGWIKVIDRKELNNVMNKVGLEYKNKLICPNQSDVFKAFELCPFNDCKMVFLGQDPYPQKGVATGILFGNKKDVSEDNLSPSLKIVKEAVINFEIPHNSIIFDQTLESWAKQGILMLNSALTCECNKIGVHINQWRPFISKLLKNLSNKELGIIYLLFGKQAQTLKPYINTEYNDIIEVEHPAYFARTNKIMPYDVFTKMNDILYKKYGEKIVLYNNN